MYQLIYTRATNCMAEIPLVEVLLHAMIYNLNAFHNMDAFPTSFMECSICMTLSIPQLVQCTLGLYSEVMETLWPKKKNNSSKKNSKHVGVTMVCSYIPDMTAGQKKNSTREEERQKQSFSYRADFLRASMESRAEYAARLLFSCLMIAW